MKIKFQRIYKLAVLKWFIFYFKEKFIIKTDETKIV